MKKERSNKAIYARFAITILVCAALGGVAGFCAAMAGKNLLDSADSLNMALASLGQLWFIPGYVLLLVSTIYYLRGKALLPQAEADDDAFQESPGWMDSCVIIQTWATSTSSPWNKMEKLPNMLPQPTTSPWTRRAMQLLHNLNSPWVNTQPSCWA